MIVFVQVPIGMPVIWAAGVTKSTNTVTAVYILVFALQCPLHWLPLCRLRAVHAVGQLIGGVHSLQYVILSTKQTKIPVDKVTDI